MRLLAPILLVFVSGCLPFLSRGSREPLPVDPAIRTGVLPNGLTWYVRENREPRARAELRLVVNAGSVLEDDDQRGLAHVVEHMAFNGTAHFEKQELVHYLERMGMRFGPDINAYTSFDETVYLLTLPTDTAGALETGLQILDDWARGITFDSLEVEKERGVVMEEWRLGQGAGSRLADKQFPVLVRGSRYAQRMPIGTRESLERFRPEAVRRFYRDWYRPELMAVVAVGDFDAVRMQQMIQEQFSDLERKAPPVRERREFGVANHRETYVSIASDRETTAATLSINMKRHPSLWTDVAAYRTWIVETLANGMMTNRLSEWTQRPNSPFLDVSTFQGRFLRPLAAFVLNARVPPNGVERGLFELQSEMTRVRQHGFTQTELEREKRQLLRRIQQRYIERDRTTSASYAADYAAHFLYGGTLVSNADEYALYNRLVPGISLRMVNAIAGDWLRPDNRVILVNLPEADSIRPPRQARLEEIIRLVDRAITVPYVDSLAKAPLLATLPAPGEIVSETTDSALAITEWVLENGVRVLVKPTDFRDDEVLLVGRSPGGSSLVSDEDYFAALTASAVVQAGGLGELSQTELRKVLTGTVAGVGADVSAMHEGVSGAASVRDLETLFQLIYLKFTAPRLDSAAVEAYRQQASSTIALRAANPDQLFADSLRAVMSQHHPRAMPLNEGDFRRLDIARSFEIYRERFADASDFTFYIVGTAPLDSLRPLVATYLGSLPSLGRVERGRDQGIRPPAGIVQRTLHKGREPRARTQIIFHGPADFSREAVLRLNLLEGVLSLRLRESLREELSGTYGVSVSGGVVGEPRPRYQLAIAFGGQPERMPELTRAVFALVDSLRTQGPTPDDLRRVREMRLRERETDLRTNQFWIERMLSYDQQDWELEDILDLPQWLALADEALVRDAARRYADPTQYVQVTLLPEVQDP